MNLIYKWDYTLVFDGRPPEEKRHEHARRREKVGSVVIDSTFISICVVICKRHFVKYVVAPAEADMQVGRWQDGAVPVCRDSDEIAYGNRYVVFIDNWHREQFRVVDLNVPATAEMETKLPLFWYYRRYGFRIIHWWAAIMGCDISEKESGVADAGRGAFINTLRSFDDDDSGELNPRSFATKVREFARPQCRLSYSVGSITRELERVARWFAVGGTFYDEAGNVRSVDGGIVRAASPMTRRHMRGDLNPKTVSEFTSDEKRKIAAIQPHNLLHNSAARRENISGCSLPRDRTTVADCKVEELKAMVVARGGNVTGRDGKSLKKMELQKVVRAYLSLEMENPSGTVYFNRSREENGIFANIDTSERKSVPEIIGQLVQCREYEPSLHQFFVDLSGYLEREKKSLTTT